MKKTYLILITILILGCSVNINTSSLNNVEDVTAGTDVGQKFYSRMVQKDYNKSFELYVDTFFKKVDTTTLLNFYRTYETKCGPINSIKIVKCETKRSGDRCEYTVMTDVSRLNALTKEVLFMASKGSQQPTILRYNVYEKNSRTKL